MKKVSVILVAMLLSVLAFAQDGKSEYKSANKNFGIYKLGGDEAGDKLMEAAVNIDKAVKDSEYRSDSKFWALKGEIYTSIVEVDYKAMVLGGNLEHPDAGVTALEALEKAVDFAEKKHEKSKALDVLGRLSGQLSAIGNEYINRGDYANAFPPLQAVLVADGILVENGEQGLFDTEENKMQHKYAVGATAIQAGETDVAKAIFKEMIAEESQDLRVYSSYFGLIVNENEEEALEVLAKGQAIDPESMDLLYAEINYLIKKEDYDLLQSKLKMAIEKDAENPSIFQALGNVYAKLAEDALTEGDFEAAETYTSECETYFKKVLELDPTSNEALYMLGSIYFNKGAAVTREMSNLGLSKEEQEKYEQLDKEVHDLFDQALPYFKKSEQMDPSDRNTLYALKEIYARLNQLDVSNEFKNRLERVEAGETIAESYFNE